MIIPITIQFFGPVQIAGREEGFYTPTWGWFPGALSASTQFFRFDLGSCFAESVLWRHIWIPRSTGNWVRLIHADEGPANITSMADILNGGQSGGGTNPTVEKIDVTKEFNQLVADRKLKQIGIQVRGDGAAQMVTYSSRLEISYRVGG